MAFILNFFRSIYELCSRRDRGLVLDSEGTESEDNSCYKCGYESGVDSDGYSSDISVESAEYKRGEIICEI